MSMGKRREYGHLLLLAALVMPVHSRVCEIGFYPEWYIWHSCLLIQTKLQKD